jgi:hypothetical protein
VGRVFYFKVRLLELLCIVVTRWDVCDVNHQPQYSPRRPVPAAPARATPRATPRSASPAPRPSSTWASSRCWS